MDVRKVIGENTRRTRVFKGLTQEELAACMGLDRAYISGLERGRRNPTAITLWRLAIALEIEPADLLKPPPNLRMQPRGKGN